jgi:protoheme ferro-lyase
MENVVESMDEIDMQAINILLNAPLMSESEMRYAITQLKRIAKRKRTRERRRIADILDYWADKAYSMSMKS